MGWFQIGPKQAHQVKISGLGLKFKGTPEKPRPASPTVKSSPFVHCRRHTRLLQSSMALRTLITRKSLGLGLGVSQSVRGLQTVSLPDLPYDYGALEPAISGEIMKLHHQKHHQTYITNYNKALEQLHEAMEKGDSSTVVKLQSAIKFNGGGLILLFLSSFSSIFCFDRCGVFIKFRGGEYLGFIYLFIDFCDFNVEFALCIFLIQLSEL